MGAKRLVFASVLAASVAGCTAAPVHTGPPSDHFDGTEFKNLVPLEPRSLWDVLRWQLGPDRAVPWPEWVDIPEVPAPPARVDHGLRVTFVNHATVLVQVGGVNVITDPVWSERVGPAFWLGPKRRKAPGIGFDALPHIDAIVLSHNHYDHFDAPTISRIVERDLPVVIGGLGTERLLAALGIGQARAIDLDWWDSREVRGVRITFAPAQHWSTRTLVDRNHTLWGSFFLAGRRPGESVYFAGDTGMGPHFRMVRERLGAPAVALLPLGAYKPRWFMASMHIDPTEAVEAHRVLGAHRSMGMHWGTFDQTDEGMDEPALDLAAAAKAARLAPGEFVALENGGHVAIVPPSAR